MEDVQRAVWSGAVPVHVRMAPNEVVSALVPQPWYAMVPRVGYLPCLADELVKHFSDAIAPTPRKARLGGSYDDDDDDDGTAGAAADDDADAASRPIWFSDQGEALRWRLPAGVLYDRACARRGSAAAPWDIVVHFSDFPRGPEGGLCRCDGADDARRAFQHALKQAAHLQSGSARAALHASRATQAQLWAAVCAGDGAAAAACDPRPLADPRRVPLRVVLDAPAGAQSEAVLVVQLPTEPRCAGGQTSIGDALAEPLRRAFGCAKPVRIVAHGVDVDARTPLVDVWAVLRNPDQFIYLCVERTDAPP
ncbi:autophagy protein Apg5-domain-containing protein [Pelagophyceae sp. CCMP2097]|nr:autophagy protein Apg5-domain-containing protein [Pelagophyceae sp. CCMP2097]